jgi:Na+/melibiose symporter-like transporter
MTDSLLECRALPDVDNLIFIPDSCFFLPTSAERLWHVILYYITYIHFKRSARTVAMPTASGRTAMTENYGTTVAVNVTESVMSSPLAAAVGVSQPGLMLVISIVTGPV